MITFWAKLLKKKIKNLYTFYYSKMLTTSNANFSKVPFHNLQNYREIDLPDGKLGY